MDFRTFFIYVLVAVTGLEIGGVFCAFMLLLTAWCFINLA
jgi:hypothetical protein